MSSFIASFLGGGGLGQKFRPLRSKSVSKYVLDVRLTIRPLKMTSLLIKLAFLFFRFKSLCPAGCGLQNSWVSILWAGLWELDPRLKSVDVVVRISSSPRSPVGWKPDLLRYSPFCLLLYWFCCSCPGLLTRLGNRQFSCLSQLPGFTFSLIWFFSISAWVSRGLVVGGDVWFVRTVSNFSRASRWLCTSFSNSFLSSLDQFPIVPSEPYASDIAIVFLVIRFS